MKEITLKLGVKSIHLQLGHTYAEWQKLSGNNENLWDVPFEELIDGTLEPNENIWYWYINGRCYETEQAFEKKKIPTSEVQRGNYIFRYFFNAGLDKETLDCDLEGVSVFEIFEDETHFLADIPTGKTLSDIRDMTDTELEEFLVENYII